MPELQHIARLAAAAANGTAHLRQGSAASPQLRTEHPASDLGNARRLIDAHGDDLSHVAGQWFVFTDGRFRMDHTGAASRRMVAVADDLLAAAAANPDLEQRKRAVSFALRSQGARAIANALELAATDQRVARRADQLDAHPLLLSAANGTIDLATGELGPARPRDLLTTGTDVAYDPAAECPRWEHFLGEVFAGDLELVEFMQRLVGYFLTGHTHEHVLAVPYGGGGNGKSTLMGVVEELLGDHHVTAGFDTFLAKHGGGTADYDLARFRGARLVVAAESAQGRRLDDRVVKQVTGGDTITARHPYGRPFSYRPTFKVALVTNHRPHVDGDDDGIWRRLRCIPFEQNFIGRENTHLAGDLARELPGILAWAVRGCLDWQHRGLGQPDAVNTATRAYRDDEDVIGAVLEDCCTLDPQATTLVADLRGTYENWCDRHGERPLIAKALTQSLERRHGVTRGRTKRGRHYSGLGLGGQVTRVTVETETRLTRAHRAKLVKHPSPPVTCHPWRPRDER